ncbi:MAG: 1-(5-phosphoribosyl)-5-[(5-phosphoribosylamino)methylideneamino]imidazole-4-carboxamide isomerase [Gemmatimonadota bacterium]|nr:1-(5-phosphoribosyl)-5-[(5-phosphoribosylamino)methylideneamino]imidazole-4-carboxamide isomerase [Gemmatimonadota bacterium]
MIRGLELFPAIDLRNGRCVRLEQGEADRVTVYDADPVEVATGYAQAGSAWVHVVDLDAAFGEGSNRALVRKIAAIGGIRVQTGGGLRSESDLEDVLEGGAARAVIGTAAIENPDLVERAIRRWGADRIAVGLDARGTRPAVRGWREDSAEDLFQIAGRLADRGVQTFIYTDISRDGMFSGPNVDVSGELADRSGAEVIVSGGVGTAAHLDEVREGAAAHRGIAGVIVGKAIYEGRVSVEEALARLRG